MNTTWCLFYGGPIDGDRIPTADSFCSRRIVVYRVAEPSKLGYELVRPAVYLRNDADRGELKHAGMDGVVRTFPTIGYDYERSIDADQASEIEDERQNEAYGVP